MRHHPLTRLLHLGLAVGITAQMATSLVMVHPKPGRLANFWYEVHEVLGLALLALLTAYWSWVAFRSLVGGEMPRLFPWASKAMLADLGRDFRKTLITLSRGKLPDADGPSPLAAALQGIGLLLGLFLAATGAVIFFGVEPGVRMTGWLHGVKEAHEAAAPLMWAYLALHPVIAFLHQMAGHGTLGRMFRVRPPEFPGGKSTY